MTACLLPGLQSSYLCYEETAEILTGCNKTMSVFRDTCFQVKAQTIKALRNCELITVCFLQFTIVFIPPAAKSHSVRTQHEHNWLIYNINSVFDHWLILS